MKVQGQPDISTQEGARRLISEMAEHYQRTDGKGRILFTRDQGDQITGTDRFRGLWASLKSIGTHRFSDDKKAFYDMVRTAYPEEAGEILKYLDARQEASGVRDMLTPGMIKAAHAKAQEIVRRDWGPGDRAGNAIAHPLGLNPDRRDLAAAIGLIKGGQKPLLSADLQNRAQEKLVAQRQMRNTSQFVACHDTAAELQQVMGIENTEKTAGGAGIDKRREAINLAKEAVSSEIPSIIQLKGVTAHADGHSFSLVSKPDGTVDVLEAWASGEHEADLGQLLGHCKTNLPKETVIRALDDIASDDPAKRTRGYTTLSTAYPDSIYFEGGELYKGGSVKTPRAPDAEIQLTARVRSLKPKVEIIDEMASRLQKVQEFKKEVSLTAADREVLQQLGVQAAELQEAW